MDTTTTARPCERCDQHGPDLPTTEAAALEAHRAWHDLVRALLVPVERLLGALYPGDTAR